jgi:hypothetical protein
LQETANYTWFCQNAYSPHIYKTNLLPKFCIQC